MGLRWLFVVALVFGFSPEASAGESGGIFHRASCSVVRYYVAKYSARDLQGVANHPLGS